MPDSVTSDAAPTSHESMRALLVSMTFPDDPAHKVHGVYQRLSLFVDALKDRFRLHLLFYVEPRIDLSGRSRERFRDQLSEFWGTDLELTLVKRQDPPDRLSRWEAYGPPTLDGFRQWNYRWANGPRQQRALEEALGLDPDLLFVHRLTAMAPVLGTGHRLPPVVFDLDDVEHRAFARAVSQPPVWPAKRLTYAHMPALWWSERKAIALADRTFVCSPQDRSYLERTMRVDGVRVVPNSVPIPEEAPPIAPAPTALFLGSLSYAPNRNAAMHLVEHVWPRVRRQVPDARLLIAGRHPEQVPASAAPPPGVEFTGFVEDLEGLYAATRVVCVPILAGGGTRIKIIEAAAFGRAIVSTSLGAEGLALQDERHLLVRDEPAAFADAVVELLRDRSRAGRLGAAGREAIRHTYDRRRVIPRIQEELLSCLPSAGQHAARAPARG